MTVGTDSHTRSELCLPYFICKAFVLINAECKTYFNGFIVIPLQIVSKEYLEN